MTRPRRRSGTGANELGLAAREGGALWRARAAGDFGLAPPDAALEVLARTLSLCTHVLIEAPDRQLAAQLLGRVRSEAAPGLAALLEACGEASGAQWLRPLTPAYRRRVICGACFAATRTSLSPSAYSGDGSWSLSQFGRWPARLWRAVGEAGPVLDADHGSLNHAQFSHDGQWIVTTHEAGGARLWTLSGAMQRSFETPASAIHAAFSFDDQMLVVGCRDRVARLWGSRRHAAGHAARARGASGGCGFLPTPSSLPQRPPTVRPASGAPTAPIAVLAHEQMVSARRLQP